VATGQREEDVVNAWLAHCQGVGLEPFAAEISQYFDEHESPALGSDAQRLALAFDAPVPEIR
jgi:hypothetical protein